MLYAKVAAYLQATPEESDFSRLETLERNNQLPTFPEVTARYLVKYLFEIGPCASNGMGLSSISWQEISAWQEQTGMRLSAWEASAIKRSSNAYAAQASISTNKDCVSPMPADVDVVRQGKDFKKLLRESAEKK